MSEGDDVDIEIYGRIASHLRRILETLGVERKPRPLNDGSPVASAAKRASAGLAPHRYPSKKASLGLRQVPPLVAVAPLGRADK
jgi:hypothetical protein